MTLEFAGICGYLHTTWLLKLSFGEQYKNKLYKCTNYQLVCGGLQEQNVHSVLHSITMCSPEFTHDIYSFISSSFINISVWYRCDLRSHAKRVYTLLYNNYTYRNKRINMKKFNLSTHTYIKNTIGIGRKLHKGASR